MEFIKTGLLCLAIAWVALALFAVFFSNSMMFPFVSASYRDGDDDRMFKLTLPDGNQITVIYLPNPEAKLTLLYSHGNGEDIGHMMSTLEEYQKFGYSVIAYDYSGYGTSQGAANEASAYAAVNAVYRHLREDRKVPAANIIAYGRSLGGGPATDLAIREPIGGLILEATFVSAFRVLTRLTLLPWDNFNNIAKIDQINCPVFITHGKRDQVVPFWHGPAIYEKAVQPKNHLWIEDAGHNNLIDIAGETYWNALTHFNQEALQSSKTRK